MVTWPNNGADGIWRDQVSSLDTTQHEPDKAEIRAWGSTVEDSVDAITEAAATGADMYESNTLGLAGTSNGDYFSVPIPATGTIKIMKNVSGVATEIFEIFSMSRVTDLESDVSTLQDDVTGLRVLPSVNKSTNETTAFANIVSLDLFGVPDEKHLFIDYFWWRDSGDRFAISVRMGDSSDGSDSTQVAQYSITSPTVISFDGVKTFGLSQVASSGVTGLLTYDFTGVSPFGLYSVTTSAEYERRRLSLGHVRATSEQGDSHITSVAESAIVAQNELKSGSKKPFSDNMTDDTLREIVRNVELYAADDTVDYSLKLYAEDYTTWFRLRIEIYDVASGVVVTSFSSGAQFDPTDFTDFISNYATSIMLNDGLVANEKTRFFAEIEFDWSSLTSAATLGGSTMESGGIHPDMVYGEEETIHLRRNVPLWDTVVTVGTGEDFTDFTTAVMSTYSFRTGSQNVNGVPVSDTSHPNEPTLIRVMEDGDHSAVGLHNPHDVHFEGRGRGRTRLISGPSSTKPTLEHHASGSVRDMTLIQQNDTDYVIHDDLVNNNVALTGSDGEIEVSPYVTRYENLDLIAEGPSHNTAIFGSGVSSGQEIYITNVRATRLRTDLSNAVFFFHNTGPTLSVPGLSLSDRPSKVFMDSVQSSNQVACEFQTLHSAALCEAVIKNCSLPLIKISVANNGEVLTDLARDRIQWVVSGSHNGAWYVLDPDQQTVLLCSPGETATGTAADALFGETDDLGRGEKWIGPDNTAYGIGARLGDCSVTNKTLTVGGQTHTFTEDESVKTQATLLSEINSSLTSNPLTVIDIQDEWVPDAATKRRVRNSTGSTIPKGSPVVFSSGTTIQRCSQAQRPDGWTHRDILNGDDGYMIETREVYHTYITGADSGTGEWGINSSGDLDYTETVKLGRTMGTIVTMY